MSAAQEGDEAANRQQELIGEPRTHVVVEGETLPDVALRYRLGYIALVAANPGVDIWTPPAGAEIRLTTMHVLPGRRPAGVVINIGDLRLYYFPENGGAVRSWPVGIGRAGLETPLLETRVTEKRRDPVWYPVPESRADNPDLPAAVPPGPDNPLGAFAIRIGWEGYLIHGTNSPWGIGRRVSRGCIRMHNEDVAELFNLVGIGTPVTVIDEPIKLGWHRGELYLQVHPRGRQVDELEVSGRFTPQPDAGLFDHIRAVAGDRRGDVDWGIVERAVRQRLGIPVRITP